MLRLTKINNKNEGDWISIRFDLYPTPDKILLTHIKLSCYDSNNINSLPIQFKIYGKNDNELYVSSSTGQTLQQFPKLLNWFDLFDQDTNSSGSKNIDITLSTLVQLNTSKWYSNADIVNYNGEYIWYYPPSYNQILRGSMPNSWTKYSDIIAFYRSNIDTSHVVGNSVPDIGGSIRFHNFYHV